MKFLAILVLTASFSFQDPPAPDPKKIDEAIDKAVKFLKEKMADPACNLDDSTELILWAFLNAKVPKDDPDYLRLLKQVEQGSGPMTYQQSLRAMVLERLDREKYRADIAVSAQLLVDGQCANGQWAYIDIGPGNLPGPKDKKPEPDAKGKFVIRNRLAKPLAATGDNSNSQFAALGLRACHEAGIVLPKETVQLAAKWWRDSQHPPAGARNPYGTPRGWSYRTHEVVAGGKKIPLPAYGSMTCGAISSLAILDGLDGKDSKKDVAILDGLAWVSVNFSVKSHPGVAEKIEGFPSPYLHYYLYSLERACALTATEKLGKHDWYAGGAKFLLDTQLGTGAWSPPIDRAQVHETCFAILFLRRATHSWVETPSSSK